MVNRSNPWPVAWTPKLERLFKKLMVGRGSTGLGGSPTLDNLVVDDIKTKSPWVDVTHPDFGAVGDGSTDDTAAIQAALDSLPSILYFPTATYKTGVLEIKANIHIIGNGSTLLGSGDGLFNVLTALDKVYIEGFTVTWVSASGTIGKQFFWNGDEAAGDMSFTLGTIYAISDLKIWNNNLDASRIAVGGATTRAKIYDNRWVHDNTVALAPAYLYLIRGDVDSDSGPVWIQDNFFDVYPPSGANKDIVKVSGGITEAVITGNYVKSNTTDSGAQIDVFTGVHKMRFIGNTLINITLERKQIKGGLPAAPTIYQFDLIMGNSFEIQNTYDITTRAIYFVGALSTITNNQFIIENSAAQCVAIDFDNSDVDITFDTDQAVANIVSNNIFDLRNAEATSYAIQFQPTGGIGADVGRYMIVSNNLLLGGQRFLSGFPTYATVIGNVWGDSSGASGTSMSAGLTSMAIGNVADTATPVYLGRDSGNMVTKTITALADDATPSVLGLGKYVLTGGTTTITDFDDGYTGQEITIIAEHSLTITDGTNIFLNGSTNFVMTATDTLTLVQKADGLWYEVSRSDSGA